MSKPRYIWWSYVKGMIRKYPVLEEKYTELLSCTMTANYSGGRGSLTAQRTTENVTVRELPKNDMKEFSAVDDAIRRTKQKNSGDIRITVIKMLYWDRSHTLQGAASALHCDYETARRWQGEFIKLVAANFGLLD